MGYREIHELLPLLIALIDLVGRLPGKLRGDWDIGNFVLPADMTVEHLCN